MQGEHLTSFLSLKNGSDDNMFSISREKVNEVVPRA
jgi:hypothetical protein